MLTRRRFLQLCSITGAGLALPGGLALGCGGEDETATTATAPKTLKPVSAIDRFIDQLPLPPALTPDTGSYPGFDYYEVRLSQFRQELHGQLPPTTVWGYEGSYPGPTIEARRGRPVRVKWINDDMPGEHLLAASIDRTIFPAGHQYPDVRTVTHLHGGFTPADSDGQPDMWSTPGAAETGPRYNPGDCIYPNEQPAAGLWYHDHAMAITRLNVYAGLAGLYIIRDGEEDALGLPSGEYEVPLVIQDKRLNEDASLSYPTRGVSAAHPIWVPTFTGDIALVNGKAWPYLEVEPRRYRLRLLNGSQTRTWNLRFDAAGELLGFHIIGSDGGLLPQAVPAQALLVAPGERYDIVVDFNGLEQGAVVTLANDAPAPYPVGGGSAIDEVMQMRVSRELSGADGSTPAAELKLPAVPRLETAGATTRDFILEEIMEGEANLRMLINNRAFHDPVEEMPTAGSTEVWQFANLSFHMHPMHIHLVQFQVIDRQPIDSNGLWSHWLEFNAGNRERPRFADYLSGPAVPALPHEGGWKDTVMAMPNEVTRVAARFDLPPDTPTPARYVYHCHILEHEDNEMMRPFEVV
ncbi:MAG: hypothetical protein C4534_00890 [Gaiellales bacterium]|nr:MAG: hypothetical protein C4534_00890 [Gaiellales bacterium]